MMKLYRFQWHGGPGASLVGTFVEDDANVAAIIGKTVDFGEVCGKRHDVSVTIEASMIRVLSEDHAFVSEFMRLGCESGTDPVSAWHQDD